MKSKPGVKKVELLKELKNAIFPSNEGDGVEHIDMSYKQFIRKIEDLAS